MPAPIPRKNPVRASPTLDPLDWWTGWDGGGAGCAGSVVVFVDSICGANPILSSYFVSTVFFSPPTGAEGGQEAGWEIVAMASCPNAIVIVDAHDVRYIGNMAKSKNLYRRRNNSDPPSRWEPEPNTGCWLWYGANSGDGYGRIRWNGKATGVHRVMYEIHRGAIPEGMEIDHLCRVRCCINPFHLEPVSKKENCLRGKSFSAWNSRKTHCLKGHELSAENLCSHKTKKFRRCCRICHNARNHAYDLRSERKLRCSKMA